MKPLLAVAVTAVIAACVAGTARADVAVVPGDGLDPSTGGAGVTTPLEAVAGSIATTIAGRPVTVRCESDDAWPSLAAENGFEPSQVLGFVAFADAPADFAELSPGVCRPLQSFAAADVKPTKCATVQRVPHRIARRLRGRLVRRVGYTTVTTPPGPCFAEGRGLAGDAPFWNAYFYAAEAIQTLAHESIHLGGDRSEADAECYGMQSLAYAAQQLGDTPDDAQAIAQYYATQLYPQRRADAPEYWSAECRPGGALDLTPGDGVWP